MKGFSHFAGTGTALGLLAVFTVILAGLAAVA